MRASGERGWLHWDGLTGLVTQALAGRPLREIHSKQTPDEMYFGTGDAVPADLMSRAAAACRTRGEANRSASCERCPSVDAAA